MYELVEIKTSELSGAALDWAVAKTQGIEYQHQYVGKDWDFKVIDKSNAHLIKSNFSPSTRINDIIPLIKKYDIHHAEGGKSDCEYRGWFAVVGLPLGQPPVATAFSESLKVAICRAIAIFEFGVVVMVPKNMVVATS